MSPNPHRSRVPASRYPIIPAEFDDIVVWVAWLYYAGQLTQSEVAKAVGLSRATVVKVLQDARERGAVTIRLNTEAVSRTKLSRGLATRCGLDAAYITPTLDSAPLTARLSDAGARVLGELLQPDDVIGVAWGRAVFAVAAAMAAPETPGAFTVVQVMGSSPGGTAAFSPELRASMLATKLSARCANLLAPAVLSPSSLRDQLMAEPAMIEPFCLIRTVNKVLFGIGDVGPNGAARIAQLANAQVFEDYVADGAVAIILGRLIDKEGRLVAGELDRRMIGVTLEALKTLPGRLCVAGGPTKVEPLLAALNYGFIQRLVTDTASANARLG